MEVKSLPGGRPGGLLILLTPQQQGDHITSWDQTPSTREISAPGRSLQDPWLVPLIQEKGMLASSWGYFDLLRRSWILNYGP